MRDDRVHRCQAAELPVCCSGGLSYSKGGFAMEILFINNIAIDKTNPSNSLQGLSLSLIHTVHILPKVLPEVLQDKFPEVPGFTSSAPEQ